jgi:hypothetical protein
MEFNKNCKKRKGKKKGPINDKTHSLAREPSDDMDNMTEEEEIEEDEEEEEKEESPKPISMKTKQENMEGFQIYKGRAKESRDKEKKEKEKENES